MQEKLNIEPASDLWEVYFFEEGTWAKLASFDVEPDARQYFDAIVAKSDLPQDYYALIGPDDKVMPLVPEAWKP